MRKIVLLFALLFCFFHSNASHLLGSEIIAYLLGGNDYVVTHTAYRDTPDIPMAENATIEVRDTNVFAIGNIYPNPVNSMIFLSLSVDKETKISILILDILGNKVWSMPENIYESGKHLISGEVNLPNGQYIAQIFKDGTVFKTQKIFVSR